MKRLAALLLAAAPVFAQEPLPLVREIVFAGNDTTEPKVMLREMSLRVGEPADPAQIASSRQAILDLGLFTSVQIEETALADGVRLTVSVKEKWYILPIPRYSVSSDGKDSYGLSLRWFNVAGLNHTLRGSWANSDEQKANKGRSTSYSLDYSMPFVFDSPYNLTFGGGNSETPILAASGNYEETFDSAFVGISRTFSTGAASRGWTVGSSVYWSNQDTAGAFAPAPYGMATALGLSAGYYDVRFKVYSEEGLSYGISASSAAEGLASDYQFTSVIGRYSYYLPLGTTPHQTLHVLARAGSYHGGPQGVESEAGVYNLGGASTLRGYRADSFVGDAFYYVTTEYLRPVGWNWLRAVAMVEVGNTFSDAHGAQFRDVYGSAGIGLRLRLITFVNVEVEMGLSWPLEGGGSRFFASRV